MPPGDWDRRGLIDIPNILQLRRKQADRKKEIKKKVRISNHKRPQFIAFYPAYDFFKTTSWTDGWIMKK